MLKILGYRVLPVISSVAGFPSSKGIQFWLQTPSNYKCNAYSVNPVFKQKKKRQKNKKTAVHKKDNFHFELILHLLHLLMTSYSKQTCLNWVIKLASHHIPFFLCLQEHMQKTSYPFCGATIKPSKVKEKVVAISASISDEKIFLCKPVICK